MGLARAVLSSIGGGESMKRAMRQALRREDHWWRDHFRMMEPDSEPEWHLAWQGLARLTGDDDFEAQHPESGEVWQYMGSTDARGHWQHEFRHRDHPLTGERRYVRVAASPGWPKPGKHAAPARKRRRVASAKD